MKFDIKNALKKMRISNKSKSESTDDASLGTSGDDTKKNNGSFFEKVGDYFNPEPQKGQEKENKKPSHLRSTPGLLLAKI